MAPEHILHKIKLLLNLTHSPNVNEAESAKAMADRLVAKYNITEEELKSIEDKKPLYGEDEKLYTTIGLTPWRQQLALAVAKHFDCQLVQEELVPVEGLHQYNYYAYGDSQDVETVKFVYNSFASKTEELIKNITAWGRGPVYIDSYAEGVVEAIKKNIQFEGIDLPAAKVPSRVVEEKVLNNGTSNLAKPTVNEKEKPAKESIDINSQSLIKDVMAYFKGLEDGNRLSLNDILELQAANEDAKQLV